MHVRLVSQAALMVVLSTIAGTAEGQSTSPAASFNVNLTGGYAGFLDENIVDHRVVGAGAEWVLTPRIALGPEVLYMIGPGSDRDLFVLGVARFGLRPFSRRVVPLAIAGGGFMSHSDRYNRETFRSSEGAFVLGGGLRVGVGTNVYVAPEVTIGWEPHLRASVSVGIRLH